MSVPLIFIFKAPSQEEEENKAEFSHDDEDLENGNDSENHMDGNDPH